MTTFLKIFILGAIGLGAYFFFTDKTAIEKETEG